MTRIFGMPTLALSLAIARNFSTRGRTFPGLQYMISRTSSMGFSCVRVPSVSLCGAPQPQLGQIRLRRLQGAPLASMGHVAEEPAVAWDIGPVGAFVEVGAHEPAVRAGRGLIDAADAAPAVRPGTRSLHGRKPVSPSCAMAWCARRWNARNSCTAPTATES